MIERGRKTAKGILACLIFAMVILHYQTSNSHVQNILNAQNTLAEVNVKSIQAEMNDAGTRNMTFQYEDPDENKRPSRKEVMTILEKMYNGNLINQGYMIYLMEKSRGQLQSLDSLYDVRFDEDTNVTIVGDVHGQYTVMLHIFQENGFPNPNHIYIFNGDFTDKGNSSIEILLTLVIFKLHCPECIHFTRGNHETAFYIYRNLLKQFSKEYNREVFHFIVDVLNELPLAITLNEKVLVTHAGITRPDLTIEEIKNISRGDKHKEGSLFVDLLWARPRNIDGIGIDKKIGTFFGPDVSEAFLELNNLDFIVRGHSKKNNGFSIQHEGRVITIWSAPTEKDMKGAYMNLASDLTWKIRQFDTFPTFHEINDWTLL